MAAMKNLLTEGSEIAAQLSALATRLHILNDKLERHLDFPGCKLRGVADQIRQATVTIREELELGEEADEYSN